MAKITFLVDHRVKQGDGKGPHYLKGETYDLERSYAQKYKSRGYAVDAMVQEPAQLFAIEPGDVIIADDWRDLRWPELKALAVSVSPDPVKSKDDAVAAIDRELHRRAEAAAAAAAAADGGSGGTANPT